MVLFFVKSYKFSKTKKYRNLKKVCTPLLTLYTNNCRNQKYLNLKLFIKTIKK